MVAMVFTEGQKGLQKEWKWREVSGLKIPSGQLCGLEESQDIRERIFWLQISRYFTICYIFFFPLNVFSLDLPYSCPQRSQMWQEYLEVSGRARWDSRRHGNILQPIVLPHSLEDSRMGRYLGRWRRSISGAPHSTHLSPRRISEFFPGSCFPNWLHGKPKTLTLNGLSSSCNAFSSVSRGWTAWQTPYSGLKMWRIHCVDPLVMWIHWGLGKPADSK